jgi:sec-independent protein translocase protein TatB
MFDIGASELLLIVVVAVVVIGPKDLPLALRTAGRWMAKVRKVSSHFRAGVDAMVREAELEELEREWKTRNEEIMKAHPDADPHPMPVAASAEAAVAPTEPQSPPPPP